jgi:ATP-dependent Clp protease ATP-binding subunit ClpC
MQFSEQIRQTINQGHAEAVRLGNNFIGTEHLLLGLLQCDNAENWLDELHVDPERLRADAEAALRGQAIKTSSIQMTSHSLPLSDQAEKVILATVREAKTRHSRRVDAHDLFVSIVRDDTTRQLLDHAKLNQR